MVSRFAEDAIEAAERRYERRGGRESGGFLWEHSVHVASLARELAAAEGVDPGLAEIVALFHDAGKFAGGRYHSGARPEEEDSASVAVRVLRKAGMRAAEIERVRRSLLSLYDEKGRRNPVADIVHDADFLSKSGRLGVASFFLKSALRGKNVLEAVLGSLSRELTYAASLPRTMRTAAGRKAAAGRSRESLRFFRGLLGEVEEARGVRFRVRKVAVALPKEGRKRASRIEADLVVPAACPACGGRWRYDLAVSHGVKCPSLEALLRCGFCGARREVSFCLPELATR